jgi:hypothetical protein
MPPPQLRPVGPNRHLLGNVHTSSSEVSGPGRTSALRPPQHQSHQPWLLHPVVSHPGGGYLSTSVVVKELLGARSASSFDRPF